MRRRLKTLADRLLGPARSLLDTTAAVLTNPAFTARKFGSGGEKRFAQSATYFVATFSSAVILNKIASWALGIELFDEVLFWILHVVFVLAIALLGVLFAVLLRSSPAMLLKAALLAYGASFLIGGVLLAGAALTLVTLREVNYIPDFMQDLAAVANFHVIGRQSLFECFRKESALFNAFGAYFDHLYETTPCGTRSVHAATDRTAEDQVRILADEHTKQNVGRPNGSIVLIGVEAQQRTLILRVRVDGQSQAAAPP